jgi:hypothetical protein
MAPKADGGGSVDVTPDEVNSAAGTFAKQQEQLGDVWSDLASALNPGMAGNDGGAQKFAAKYDPAARAVWKAFGSAVRVIGGTAQGLVQTANNYVKAEEHSTTGKKPGSAKYPPPPVADDMTVGGPDPAEGTGHSSVPDWLAQYWPNGDPDQLRAAATAWRTARDGVGDVTTTLHGAVVGITDYNNAEDITQMEAFWNTLAKPGDKKAILTGLHDACDSIAKACDAYAQAIDDARSNLKTALAEAGIAVAFTTIIGILATPFTLGGSDAAAGAADAAEVAAIAGPLVEEFETTVAAEVGEAIAEDVAIDLETTAEAVPDIETAEAEAEDVDATVEEELEQTETESGGEREIPTPHGRAGTVDDLNPQQVANYKRYVKKLPAKAEPTQIEVLEDGGIRMSSRVPANNIPGSYADYVKIIDENGDTVQYVKNTYDASGKLVHSKVK